MVIDSELHKGYRVFMSTIFFFFSLLLQRALKNLGILYIPSVGVYITDGREKRGGGGGNDVIIGSNDVITGSG